MRRLVPLAVVAFGLVLPSSASARVIDCSAKAELPRVEPERRRPPDRERRTVQIGERPGPLRPAPPPPGAMRPLDERWTPRLIAVVALAVLVIVVVLLLLFAL